ncbi:homeobox-leucine zipper protein ATHB-40-like [Lycium ferocissimum]|uniref:homeobox-leucine zipper protein ATHB-40-like n=1 Tax=Lycium ferocissimum TaxID=112874 RepID=UPI002815479E|nr:homeobox-leucine zipper protein ATHB-40-like [Lycium ferocissimum]
MDIISSSMNHQVDDQRVMISQYYPGIYTQLVPERGEVKPRWRRKKNKGEVSSNTSGVVRKRKLSEEQVNLLERSFGNEQKLETGGKDKLASELGLDPQQVAVWFQNRRARWKKKKLEDEYFKLKAEHETMIVQKNCLETEVLKMKEQLSEAEKKIQRLLLERNCNNSPISTSSYSMEQPHFLGEFGIIEEILMDNNVFFIPDDQNSYINSLG